MAWIRHVLCGPGVGTFCLPKLLRWKTKRLYLLWQSWVLSGGMSLCISRLDKTLERWHLCLLTDDFLVWHLTGGRSASISQPIVHLVCNSVALMKIQGNIFVGSFFNYLIEGFFFDFGFCLGFFEIVFYSLGSAELSSPTTVWTSHLAIAHEPNKIWD